MENLSVTRTIYYSELSETLQKYMYRNTNKEYRERISEKTFEVYDYHTAVKPKYSREYEYEYYASKYSVKAFETGEIDEIGDWLTKESYDELPPEERKEYVFFRWTEPHSWYKTLGDIITRVEVRFEDFREAVSWEKGMWEYFQHITPVRLIVEVS